MTKLLLVGLFLIIPLLSVWAQTPKDTQRELRALDAAFREADVKGNAEVLRRMLADDYFGIGSRGETYTKSDEVSLAEDLSISIVTDDVVVRLYGDTGIVTGRSTVTAQGVTEPKRYRYTSVYVRRKGAWQLVSYQMTTLTR